MELLETYLQFLRVLTKNIDEHFESQKEYIHCKRGCAHCCKNAEFPCTQLEFDFLRLGFFRLSPDVQQKIVDNIAKIKEEMANHSGDKFKYDCPFLIDDVCSVYDYRMIICRTFGLAYYKEDPKTGLIVRRAPFCMELGLNYGEVYDPETKMFLQDKYLKTGYKQEPLAYNTSSEFLRERLGKDFLGLDFGEEKALIDWLLLITK